MRGLWEEGIAIGLKYYIPLGVCKGVEIVKRKRTSRGPFFFVLCARLEEGSVRRAVLPKEVDVEKKESIAHDRSSCEQASIKKQMESNNVYGERKDEKGGQRFAFGPEGDEAEGEHHRHNRRDVPSIHENLDERECFWGVVEVCGRSREDAECTEDRHDTDETQENFKPDVYDFFHTKECLRMKRVYQLLQTTKNHWENPTVFCGSSDYLFTELGSIYAEVKVSIVKLRNLSLEAKIPLHE